LTIAPEGEYREKRGERGTRRVWLPAEERKKEGNLFSAGSQKC
jgi:hypothetical protein